MTSVEVKAGSAPPSVTFLATWGNAYEVPPGSDPAENLKDIQRRSVLDAALSEEMTRLSRVGLPEIVSRGERVETGKGQARLTLLGRLVG